MTIPTILALSALGLVLTVALLILTVRSAPVEPPADWLARATSRRLVVHTSDDRSIEGTVASVGADGVVLSAARLLGAKEIDMAGDVWIPRSKVVFVQAVH
ncbi:hypothetical protein K6U06_06560 [Acidiferrimicrobium sp. IK]|uniref:hypothetical protein n=1 Tax=Acidiferrimicrobium sp. IK TaxID=2871700 RepID=UPI0021CB551A|nr:hypothetical protein [Acidiferrimicrobium sp. IK]MCU4184015.1 hypothetical protein [Acidiferrimicrobium sp. IK]